MYVCYFLVEGINVRVFLVYVFNTGIYKMEYYVELLKEPPQQVYIRPHKEHNTVHAKLAEQFFFQLMWPVKQAHAMVYADV